MNDVVSADENSDRCELIEEFAAALRELRADAGNPSFRAMAARSGKISHTTLHEAATGHRFASWSTTREYVKACGGDLSEWGERWQEVSTRIQHSQSDDASPPRAQSSEMTLAVPVAPPQSSRRKWTAIGVVTAAATTAAAVTAVVTMTGTGGDSTASAQPVQGVRISGDRSRFINDVTIPDGTHVKVGQRFLKVWQIENAGSVTWAGRYLQRMDLPPGQHSCKTPDRVSIPYSAPGALVDISVPVVAADVPGNCWVGWKMVDDKGHPYLASARPLYFLVTVTPN
jgi:hypothetical protein